MPIEFPSGWKLLPVESCMAAIIDYRGKSPRKVLSGIPLITAKIVKNGRILPPDEYIAEKDYSEWMRRGIPEAGDILVTTEAPLGEVAQLDGRKVALAQRLITLRGIADVLDNRFLKFAMQSEFVQNQLRARATGTTVHGVRQSELREVQLPIPPISEQRAIAKILSALDDKIESNRRMNETLEAMARAIFKSWFADFDPVRAKAEGRQPFGMDAETAALFPRSFENSSHGKIPKGWIVRPLDTVAQFLNGLALQKYPPRDGDSLPVIKIAQLHKGNVEGADRAASNLLPDYIVEDGDVLLSWSGSLEVVIWCGGRGALNQHLFKVTSRDYSKWFYYSWIREHLPEFQAIASGKATTMGHIQRHHLTEANVLVPDKDLLAAMDKIIAPLLEGIITNELQSRALAGIRDALLPKLISGEIRVLGHSEPEGLRKS